MGGAPAARRGHAGGEVGRGSRLGRGGNAGLLGDERDACGCEEQCHCDEHKRGNVRRGRDEDGGAVGEGYPWVDRKGRPVCSVFGNAAATVQSYIL